MLRQLSKVKEGNRQVQNQEQLRAGARAGRFAMVALAGAVLGGLGIAAQSSSNVELNAQLQGEAIIAHLSSVIQFYRSVREPIQKAGEPNDVVYQNQAVALAGQAANLAFQSAKAEAALIQGSQTEAAGGTAQEEKLAATTKSVETRISDLQGREAALDRRIASASGRAASALQAQKEQVQAALALSIAMKEALQKIESVSDAASKTGLSGEISQLQGSVPELVSQSKMGGGPETTIGAALSSGLTSQAGVLLELVETQHSLAMLRKTNDRMRQQVSGLRAPMLRVLRGLIQQGEQLSQQAGAATPAGVRTGGAAGGPGPAELQSITSRFTALSNATVPLSEELIVLNESGANLAAWQASAEQEYTSVLHALLLRVLVICVALGVIVLAGEVWTRATNKYIKDRRRRRQLLIVRRVVVGFLSVLVVVFGFVTQFNSLATFAGFITAGIAVGLQTVLLSVAAYFFIIGRFGIKVGDRITIAAVTGDVIEVGLVRFYVMELSGTGTSLNPTGRVAVFSNAVLFQAGTPLYKQLPGTEYAWHEMTVQLADGIDYKAACDALLQPVHAAYEEYRPSIERQHEGVQNWMQATIESPGVESRLQFSGGAFQLWVRYPVEIGKAGSTDEKITHALLDLMAANPAIKAAVAGRPSIQPSVRG